MKLKPYPEYKDSGVKWIGEIPEGWKFNKIKHNVLALEKSGMEASEGSEKGEYPFFTSSQVQNKFIDKVIFNGECLIMGTGGFTSIHYYKGKFSASNDCLVLKRQKLIDMKFLYYQILSNLQVIDDLGFWGTGLRHLQKYFFYNLLFYFPKDKQDQTAIASFLDKQTARIDTLIEKDKKLIALLKEKQTALINHAVTKGLDPNVKLKGSGVEWIGEIPSNAKIVPFRRVCRLNQGLQFPQDERLEVPEENSKIYITIKYIHSEEKMEEYIPNPPKSVVCKKQDVLLARTGATGEVITNQEGVFHNNFFKINYDSSVNRDYLVYYLQMNSVKELLLLKAGITTIPDLNHDAFLDTPFIHYNYDTQTQIVEYLDKATAKIDKTIKLIEKKINLLEEYKKSLIHYVVTGKIDVRRELKCRNTQ